MKANKFVFSPLFRERQLLINYVDIGARGDVGQPWALFDQDSIRVIGFEPDPDEAASLSARFPNRKYYQAALWSEGSIRTFYLNRWASTSSMFPANCKSNERFGRTHWEGRSHQAVIAVPCLPLDEVLDPSDAPDFMKIDTHGSELEILRGATKTLEQYAPLVLVETWCEEVYLGAPMSHDVMAFMYALGYRLFDLTVAAAWEHATRATTLVASKARLVGLDLLFVKNAEGLAGLTEDQFLKHVGLCELFGFRDYSLYLLDCTSRPSGPAFDVVNQQLLANNRRDRRLMIRLRERVGRALRWPSILYPPLH